MISNLEYALYHQHKNRINMNIMSKCKYTTEYFHEFNNIINEVNNQIWDKIKSPIHRKIIELMEVS